MKKVWVNRFNADGSYKPMSEWVQRECAERYTHTYPLLNDGHGFDGGGLPAHHCFISSFGKIAESGFFYEYIGDQRGDGWFNVEDEQPPKGVPVLVFRDPKNVKELTQDDVAIGTYWGDSEPSFGHAFELSEGGCWFLERCDTLLWQPIHPPKHVD